MKIIDALEEKRDHWGGGLANGLVSVRAAHAQYAQPRQDLESIDQEFPNGYPLLVFRCGVRNIEILQPKVLKHFFPEWNKCIGKRYLGHLELDPNINTFSARWTPDFKFTEAGLLQGFGRMTSRPSPPGNVQLCMPPGHSYVKRRVHQILVGTNYWRVWFSVLEDLL